MNISFLHYKTFYVILVERHYFFTLYFRMAEVLVKSASQWVDAIDIGGDKKTDITNTEMQLKMALKKDL